VVSGVPEDDPDDAGAGSMALRLAERKAVAVARPDGDAVVVGCDSILEFEGRRHGKPSSAEEALRWLRAMRGREGTLHTGHCLVDERTGGRVSAVAATVVRFGDADDAELEAYVATGEAAAVAGAFTLDGRSAPFIDGIVGDPSNVIGLSLPMFRTLLRRLGIPVTALWAR
jgi:septum formation protein